MTYTGQTLKSGHNPLLNRIYIVVGLLVIIALAGAFIAPRFIQWSDYRDRMEQLASGVLGTEVSIRGDIEFSLLPQPRLHFSDVVVGDAAQPAATVDRVDAEFSLVDFLRDNYNVTRLVLDRPVVDLTVDESGLFSSGFALPTDGGAEGRVTLSQAQILNATIKLADLRSGESFVADNINGDLKLAAIIGPFQFQGDLDYAQIHYSLRFNTSAVDEGGSNRLTGFVSNELGMSLAVEGQFMPGMAPKFDGTMTYRQKPPATAVAGDIRGDLVLESKVTGSTDRIVLTGYTLQPDENRAGTRLTGAASVQLGRQRSFDAVISGGVFALPPRDASEDLSSQPYDVVRLLGELPAPILPPMSGRIGVDLAEIGLRSFALRSVRVDAHTDGAIWTVDSFIAQLPGDTEVRASGSLGVGNGHPSFDGALSVATQRLDGLSALWRKPVEGNPMFNMPATWQGKILLAGDALGFSEGVFTLDGVLHSLGLRVGFGTEPRLDVTGKFGALSSEHSAALAALLPEVQAGPAFGISFPDGSFGLSGAGAELFGLRGQDLVAEGQWARDRVTFTRLAASDLGGMSLDAAVTVSGTATAPVVWGTGKIGVQSPRSAGLAAVLQALQAKSEVVDYLGRQVPAALSFEIGQPFAEGGQTLAIKGRLNTADLDMTAQLGGGLAGMLTAPLALTASLEGADPDALTQQLGFGAAEIFPPDGDIFVAVNMEGSPTNSFATRLNASVGEERVGFVGNLLLGPNGELQGSGTLDGYLADAGGLAQVIGARGLSLPMVSGTSELHFEGERLLRLSEINGKSGDVGFAGELSVSRTNSSAVASGTMKLDRIDVAGLTAVLTGPASLLMADGDIWPSGPIVIGEAPRQTRGSIAITAPIVTVGGPIPMTDASFTLSWDETKLRLARFMANMDGGQVGLDVSVCCSDALVNKTLAGRVTLAAVPLDSVLPTALSEALDGDIGGGLRFSGTGDSLQSVLAALTGEGSFSIAKLGVQHLDPSVFPAVAKLQDLLQTDGDALAALIGISLEQGPFTAPLAAGAFTIAGGTMRIANLSIDGADARLAGDSNIELDNLALTGAFTLTPLGIVDPHNLVTEATARIVSRVSGTILAPERTLDLDTMVATIQMRANEIEVARLEALRLEDAARQRAAALERNRLIAEQHKRDQEAARLKAEAEKKRLEEEALKLQQPGTTPTVPPLTPIDLGLPQFH